YQQRTFQVINDAWIRVAEAIAVPAFTLPHTDVGVNTPVRNSNSTTAVPGNSSTAAAVFQYPSALTELWPFIVNEAWGMIKYAQWNDVMTGTDKVLSGTNVLYDILMNWGKLITFGFQVVQSQLYAQYYASCRVRRCAYVVKRSNFD